MRVSRFLSSILLGAIISCSSPKLITDYRIEGKRTLHDRSGKEINIKAKYKNGRHELIQKTRKYPTVVYINSNVDDLVQEPIQISVILKKPFVQNHIYHINRDSLNRYTHASNGFSTLLKGYEEQYKNIISHYYSGSGGPVFNNVIDENKRYKELRELYQSEIKGHIPRKDTSKIERYDLSELINYKEADKGLINYNDSTKLKVRKKK